MLSACLFCAPSVLDKIRTLRTIHAPRRQQIHSHTRASQQLLVLLRLETVGAGLAGLVAKQRLPCRKPCLPTKMTGRKRTAIGPSGQGQELSPEGETTAGRQAVCAKCLLNSRPSMVEIGQDNSVSAFILQFTF